MKYVCYGVILLLMVTSGVFIHKCSRLEGRIEVLEMVLSIKKDKYQIDFTTVGTEVFIK
jgi:hypothetical protein